MTKTLQKTTAIRAATIRCWPNRIRLCLNTQTANVIQLTPIAVIVPNASDVRSGSCDSVISSELATAVMAAAAKHTIAQVSGIVPTGGLDPENIVTPGIYVNSIVQVA